MGSSVSKNQERNDALILCKERMRFIKQAIDSRYALSAAHLSYIESLRNVGTALRKFAEAEILAEPSLSISEPDKSPSNSSYASPSPSRLPEPSISTPPSHHLNFMTVARGNSVTISNDPSLSHFIEEDTLTFPLPPPPPPPPADCSWDFFDPTDIVHNTRIGSGNISPGLNFDRLMGQGQLHEDSISALIEEDELREINGNGFHRSEEREAPIEKERGAKSEFFSRNASIVDGDSVKTQRGEKEKDLMEKEMCGEEREDPSEFITHRAKDLLSSIKYIEQRFLRAAESGSEVSRMLETRKIRLAVSETTGKSSVSFVLSALHINCCQTEGKQEHESNQNTTKVITWNRSVSSHSWSSRIPLTSASKDDVADSATDFTEDLCMISGSHSSTLDRLYAWERKLHDEVKASEFIRKPYDRKCAQLRHQFTRDANSRVIDKTRSIVKDLHSRLRVAIQAVDLISRRIEKLRDEELQPQLSELIMGLIRMWRTMLECHHTQYITISLAYQVKSSTAAPSKTVLQAVACLRSEMNCFSSAFSNWVTAQKTYVEATNNWLQKCVLQPQECSRGRRAVVFSPRRVIAPPIFVLCRDWLAGVGSLPFDPLLDSIQEFLAALNKCFVVHSEDEKVPSVGEDSETEKKNSEAWELGKGKDRENSENLWNLESLQANLAKLLDWLQKFSESSLKLYMEVKQATETARNMYSNGRIT